MLLYYNTKEKQTLKQGLVASYDLRSGHIMGLFLSMEESK